MMNAIEKGDIIRDEEMSNYYKVVRFLTSEVVEIEKLNILQVSEIMKKYTKVGDIETQQ